MFRDQKAGQNHSIKIAKYYKMLEQFKYLGTTLTYKICIQEGIKSRMKSENAFYHSVQNLLSSTFLFKNIKFKV